MGALYDYIYAEGREEGRFQTYAKIINQHIVKHACSVHEAMEFFEVPQEDAEGVLMLVNEEMHKQAAMKRQESQDAVHEMHLKGKAEPIQKYIQKTGCTIHEVFEFFEIPEEDRNVMSEWIKI